MGLKDNICVFEDRKWDEETRSSVELFSFFCISFKVENKSLWKYFKVFNSCEKHYMNYF